MIKYNKTIHRFPPKPYIKIDPRQLQAKLDAIERKKNARKYDLLEVTELLPAKVVTDTLLLEHARRLVDGG